MNTKFRPYVYNTDDGIYLRPLITLPISIFTDQDGGYELHCRAHFSINNYDPSRFFDNMAHDEKSVYYTIDNRYNGFLRANVLISPVYDRFAPELRLEDVYVPIPHFQNMYFIKTFGVAQLQQIGASSDLIRDVADKKYIVDRHKNIIARDNRIVLFNSAQDISDHHLNLRKVVLDNMRPILTKNPEFSEKIREYLYNHAHGL